LHDAQGAVAGALQPLEVAAERIARPVPRRLTGWTKDLFNARSENEKLRTQNEQLKQQVIQNESALQENVRLKSLLHYRNAPAFPQDYDGVAAEVISQPSRAFDQTIVVSAGSNDGVVVDAPVVTADGLVGTVTRVTPNAARVRLLTDESSAVSALDLRTGASGIVEHGQSGDSLVLSRVSKKEVVNEGDEIITAGSRSGELPSRYPKGITIGHVDVRRPAQHRSLSAGARRLGRRLLGARLGPRARLSPAVAGAALVNDNLALALIVFVAALLQVTLVASLDVAGGAADVLLLALLSIALLRGAVTGAIAGFFGGLIVDIVTLDTLGVTALLYALAGYWTGRYGETTGRDRRTRPCSPSSSHGRDRLRRLRPPLPARRGGLGAARLFETLLPTSRST
jgi:rod shape-determining protein MreC